MGSGLRSQPYGSDLRQTQGDVFEVTLPDGGLVVLDASCSLELLDETEPVRAER